MIIKRLGAGSKRNLFFTVAICTQMTYFNVNLGISLFVLQDASVLILLPLAIKLHATGHVHRYLG